MAKIVGKLARILSAENGDVEVTFTTKDRATVKQIATDKTLVIEIKKQTQKRTQSANAYFWELADKLAVRLSERGERPLTKVDIYRQYIRDVGAFKTVPIAAEDIERWTDIWASRGEGWIVEDLGEAKTQGYHNLRCYYGSSVYDTKQMSRLIEMLVSDCKDQNIETLTPTQIAELISLEEQAKRAKE